MPTWATANNTPLYFDHNINGAGANDWTQNNHEISGYGDGWDSNTVQQLFTHEIYATTYTHDNVTWTESWGDNIDLLAHFPQVNFVGDIGIVTNTNGFQNFTAAINGYTLNPTIDWDGGYDPSQINWDHADNNIGGAFNSGDWGTFTEIQTPDQANNTMTLSFSGSMTTVGGETLENVDIDVILDTNEYLVVSMTGTATLNGNQVVFEHSIIADTFANSTVGITTDANGDSTVIVTDTNGNSSTITDVENFNFSDQSFDIASLQANDSTRPLFASPELVDGAWVNSYILPDVFYSGNAGLDALYDYQYYGDNDGNILVASDKNDFINGFGGDDAINTGAGNDIIDGGLGSNFLTGGTGNDTFFSDGREAGNGAITWSTVTDFTDGTNAVNIWGYIDGTSTYEWYADAGATGWTGATLHADLDGNGTIDTSMTFTGMDIADMSTPQGLEVGGNGYLLIG